MNTGISTNVLKTDSNFHSVQFYFQVDKGHFLLERLPDFADFLPSLSTVWLSTLLRLYLNSSKSCICCIFWLIEAFVTAALLTAMLPMMAVSCSLVTCSGNDSNSQNCSSSCWTACCISCSKYASLSCWIIKRIILSSSSWSVGNGGYSHVIGTEMFFRTLEVGPQRRAIGRGSGLTNP